MIAAHFNNRAKLIDFLGSALRKGRLALFIGAGISQGLRKEELVSYSNLPDWKGLLCNLFRQHSETLAPDANLITAAEQIRVKFYADNVPGWISAVRNALYDGVALDFELIRKNDTLGAIGAFAMASARGRISQLVTLNFDDVLERYLAYHGVIVAPVFEEKFWAGKGDVVIYHPHGFLPSPNSPFLESSKYVVLDRKSYSERTGRADQRMNQVMETILQSHICMFVGLSGDDPRLDSLIVTTKDDSKHAYTSGGIGYWGVAFGTSKDPSVAKVWAERGIFLQVLEKYDPDLPRFLFEVCQSAAKAETARKPHMK